MEAETLNCPMCGAAASTDSTQCAHCGARLATVACPSCFGMMFVGEKFCSHCGAMAQHKDLAPAENRLCPRCKKPMEVVEVGNVKVNECFKCEGMWVDAATLEQLCADREKQSAVLGMPTYQPTPAVINMEENFHYVPCPVCHTLMNRVNFARCSGVVVDVCKQHGTWFDRDELRRIVEFIRQGGIEKARAQAVQEIEQQQRRLQNEQRTVMEGSLPPVEYKRNYWTDLLGDAIESLLGL